MTQTDNRHQNKDKINRIVFTAIPLLVLLAGFAVYAWRSSTANMLSLTTAAAMLFLYCLCIIRLIPQWQLAWSGQVLPSPTAAEGKRSLRPAKMHPFFQVFFLALVSRFIIFFAVYLLHIMQNGYQGGFMDLLHLWVPSGSAAADWMTLADEWYSTSGEHISLLPFYPAAVRLLSLLFGNTVISGLLLSSLSFAASAWLVYELTLFDNDRSTAMTAARWFCLLPAGLLLMLPTADSLFLMLCLCCMVLARKQRYFAASMFGMIAAFTRLAGILLVLPLCIELVAVYRKNPAADDTARHPTLASACSLLLVPLGTVLYALICQSMTGDPLYLVHSGNLRIGFFFDAAAQHLTALLAGLQNASAVTVRLHGMQLLHFVLPLLLLIAAIPRMRTSYSAYLLLYIALAVGTRPAAIPTLIVSAFPLLPMLVSVIRRRFTRGCVTILLIIGLCASAFAQAMQIPLF